MSDSDRHPPERVARTRLGDDAHRAAAKNRLLSALAPDDFAWPEPHLERVPLAAHQVLAESGERWSHVYFPETSIVSVVNRMADGGAVERVLFNRYTHAYLTQVAQTAACNRLHHFEARCARWLLMTHDWVGDTDAFPLKQEFLALMLGVRRAGVTVAAGALQEAGLIRYRRGGIRVLDRAGLEAASCECYSVVRRHFDRLLA